MWKFARIALITEKIKKRNGINQPFEQDSFFIFKEKFRDRGKTMLTFKEFLRLSNQEKIKMYEQLNDHDKFLARMNDWSPEGVIVLKESSDSKDIQKQEEIMKQLEKAIEEGKVNLL